MKHHTGNHKFTKGFWTWLEPDYTDEPIGRMESGYESPEDKSNLPEIPKWTHHG